jgi:hypothetical protein
LLLTASVLMILFCNVAQSLYGTGKGKKPASAPVVTESPEKSAADPELCTPGAKIDAIFTESGSSFLFKGNDTCLLFHKSS